MSAAAQKEQREERPGQPQETATAAVDRFDWLPCHLSLEIPVGKFTVGDLLRLGKNSVVPTGVPTTQDVPLRANGQLIAWIQFELIGDRLAARITDLA